jgi:energy-coupling factor transporter transmembrane protein EcfT
MSVNTLAIILLSLFEIVALIVAARLMARSRVRFLSRVLWSLVLLVPFFGLMLYLFLHEEPEAHPYTTGDSGWNVGSSGNGGGEYGGRRW